MDTKKMGRIILLTIILAALSTSMAFAAEGDPIDVTGYIMELNPEDGTITIDVDGDPLTSEDVYIILVGDNFDFDKHLVDDLITVQGTVGEDDVVLLTELKIQERARDQVKLQEGELDSYYCNNVDQDHPVAAKVAVTYGVDYSDIQDYLCGVTTGTSVPLGQIMLALSLGGDYTEYLDGFENSSWGQIWQELGEQGKPDHGTPPGQIQDKQGEGDSEEPDTNGKKNKDGVELSECDEEDGIFCEAYEWFQSKSQSQKGKK